MYRFHPQTVKVLELVADGAIGDVTHVDASFAFDTGGRSGRLFDTATAGGGILDVGCYPLSFARFVAGAAQGRAFVDPTALQGSGTLGETGVDEWATAEVALPGDITERACAPECACPIRSRRRSRDPGASSVCPTRGVCREKQAIELDVVGEEPQRIEIPAASAYALEADALARAARDGSGPRGHPGEHARTGPCAGPLA